MPRGDNQEPTLFEVLAQISRLERAIYDEFKPGLRNELVKWESIRDRLIAKAGL